MELYHVLSRGVDKRKIFLNEQDYFRFIHDLFEFNDQDWVNTTHYIFRQSNDLRGRKIAKHKPRKLLVDIHAFCLMPNHFHLLLTARVENGISRFMRKLNMGYAKYFNQKYERKGTLFESRYKAILIKDRAHFIHIPYYIHCNPLDLEYPSWRNRKLKNPKSALKFLDSYRWSSHIDYSGGKNFPSVTNRNLLLKFFGDPKEYQKRLGEWLKEMEIDAFRELTLD